MINTFLKTIVLMLSLATLSAQCQSSSSLLPDTTKKSGTKIPAYDENRFRPIIDTLLKIYKRQQFLYNRDHLDSRFSFNIIPITLYPLFCVDVVPDKKTEVIYIYNGKYSAFYKVDNRGGPLVQVGVEDYTRGTKCPLLKNYRLYFFIYNTATCQWEEERKAKEIVIELTDESNCFYGCRTLKKAE